MLKTISSVTNAIGALNFKGTWNASTNTPTIVSGVGVKGDYFVVSVAGSTTIDGISNWGVGDWITYNGTVWQRVEGGADLNGVNLSVSGTSTLSNLTASTALALNASKQVVSVTNTGTGDNVLATSPTLVTPILGTPQSGTVTNLTGTASININGTVGATTANTGSFTTLNTSGQVVFNDAGANVDFRVEGDTEANLLFLDASADAIGIGTGTPTNGKLEIATGSTTAALFVQTGGVTVSHVIVDFRNGANQSALSALGNNTVFVSSLGTGIVYSNAGILTSVNPSDERLKIDIQNLSWGLADILALRPVSYKWKTDKIEQGTQYGFIAQEVQLVMPDLVREFETADGTRYGLEKDGIYAAMVKAIQELTARVAALEAQ